LKKKIYQTIIDEVIQNVRETFFDEGLDEQSLQELKTLWETKLNASRAINIEQEAARLPVAFTKETTKDKRAHQQQQQQQQNPRADIESSTQAAINALPPSHSQAILLQQQQQKIQIIQQIKKVSNQVDGIDDSSSDDEDIENLENFDVEDEDEDDLKPDEDAYEGKEDPEPLNSSDDVSEPDPSEIFDTDNVIVCQYDKITRIKNRWKFHLKGN
jgi:hypothetical protein